MRLILASSSPRRKELLDQLKIPFEVKASDLTESFWPKPKISVWQTAIFLATQKAKKVQENYPEALILGADTMVVLKKKVMGKPKDSKEAIKMLTELSGKTHSVITGIALVYKKKNLTAWSETKVTFEKFSSHFILEYVRTGEPMDKAGAYGIQGLGALCVREIQGDYFNVVGLPLLKTWLLLKKIGFIQGIGFTG